nr:uncharacterized protein LOC133601696 [Nerophis lumbriciformis]
MFTRCRNVTLPFAALRQLAPPVRLVSAALWKVMKQRDVARYGVLADFVASTCETVTGLLTLRHQAKLQLGLRSRLIMELLRDPQPDASAIKTHLKRITVPTTPSTSSSNTVKTDVKVRKSVESFHLMVHEMLADPVARLNYFQEDFQEDYGPLYDQTIEKRLWEFLIRLDQLLPVPSLSQTVSWLGETPAVLEECAQAASQPQLLKILLDHQTSLGHPEAMSFLPSDGGDSILTSQSLPLSGRARSNPAEDSSEDGNLTELPANDKSKECGDKLAGVKRRRPADDEETVMSPERHALINTCLSRQAKVVIPRLSSSELGRGTAFFYGRRPKTLAMVEVRNCDGKENQLTGPAKVAVLSPFRHLNSPGSLVAASDDYVPDSEDESTKKFKERLFNKRYYRTKHGSYVPTLREFWKRTHRTSLLERRR